MTQNLSKEQKSSSEDFISGALLFFGGERKQVKRATEEIQAISPIPALIRVRCRARAGTDNIRITRFPFNVAWSE